MNITKKEKILIGTMLIKSKDVNAMCILKDKEVMFAYIAGMISCIINCLAYYSINLMTLNNSIYFQRNFYYYSFSPIDSIKIRLHCWISRILYGFWDSTKSNFSFSFSYDSQKFSQKTLIYFLYGFSALACLIYGPSNALKID